MSNAARRQLGIAVEQPSSNKNQHLPTHDFHIGQEVMCQSPIIKRWFPANIKALCPEPRSYQIETQEGITYRRTQNHLKLFKSHQKTQTKEQYLQKCLNTNRTPANDDCKWIQVCLKTQSKNPVKSTCNYKKLYGKCIESTGHKTRLMCIKYLPIMQYSKN